MLQLRQLRAVSSHSFFFVWRVLARSALALRAKAIFFLFFFKTRTFFKNAETAKKEMNNIHASL